MTQTAINKETGERLALINGQWQPVTRTAANEKTGERLALVGDEWIPLDAPKDSVLRQLGLTARAGLGGVAKTFTGLNDSVNMAANEVLRMTGSDHRQAMTSPMVDTALDRIGLPKPGNDQERAVQTVGEFVAGASGPIKAGQLSSKLGPLAQNPGVQGASAVTGGSAMAAADQADATPGQKVAATVAGSMLPGFGVPAVQAGLRGTLRGNKGATMRENIDMFDSAGSSPSIGQATESRLPQATESILSRMPGGSGAMRKAAESQNREIADTVEGLANRIAPKATPERTGRVVEEGIAGKGGFVERFKSKASGLYDEVDRYIDPEQPVALSETAQFFSVPTSMAKNAPNTAKKLSSTYLEELGVALKGDVKAFVDKNGFQGLPYAAVKEIRTAVGERLGNMTLVVDATKGQLKRLYGALSHDLKTAAKNAGPDAEKAAARADRYWRAGIDRIENIERVVNKAGGSEKVYKALMSGTADGATTLRTVMRSLEPDERNWVTATVVRRMGRATPGRQDADGEAFSLGTYLTNWNRLSPEAKSTLFAGQPPDVVEATNHIAKVAQNVGEGAAVFANPSGTQPAVTAQTAVTGGAVALATGHIGTLAGIVAGVVGSNLMARGMTNRNFVNWLAKSTSVPPGAYPAAINQLAQIAAETGDQDLMQIAKELQAQ